ncbi:uncharacterized protein LOC134178347 isoform X2 [Corticium candelabrum]|uniref:uncharacterized protein LOC134178347 isoform X2 n=1 Tax=Corticium candelabrum TaxID=121492 RepID=UPI002E27710F|nr:uncharacterized protein LOC134178347 isoform X2 [Corticium candelabrum]
MCLTEQNHNSVNSSGKVSSTSPVDATTEHYIHKEDTDTLTIKQLEEKVANLATENSYLQNKIQERLAAEEEMKAMLKSHEEENLQVNCIQDENKSLLKQVSDLRERLESQAKRQVEQSGLSESLGDPQRSSELARRYTELYDSSVLQLLDQLDSFDNLTEDDLNHFALEIFKECIAATDRCIMNQVSSVSEFLHCNESNRGEVRDSIRATVLLNLRSNKDKAIDINSIKEDVLRFIKLPVQWSESCEESVIQSVALFVMDCLKFLLDVKCQGNSYTFESFDGIQFQTDRHRRYHSSSTTGVHVKQYVWPAFIDVSVDKVLCKGWVIT